MGVFILPTFQKVFKLKIEKRFIFIQYLTNRRQWFQVSTSDLTVFSASDIQLSERLL